LPGSGKHARIFIGPQWRLSKRQRSRNLRNKANFGRERRRQLVACDGRKRELMKIRIAVLALTALHGLIQGIALGNIDVASNKQNEPKFNRELSKMEPSRSQIQRLDVQASSKSHGG
jgi:hypothetical protein